ncbi:class D beta-lactamase [Devosia sp. CAU 1758]
MPPKLTALAFGLFLLLVGALPAQASTICTLVADAKSRTVLLSEGDCESRVTPASTFKLPLAVIAFDAGIVLSQTEPRLPYKQGYADWISAWRQDTDPTMWIHNSNVWYSQRITEQLGMEQLVAYARSFHYGNADFSGDPGRNNGLERSWISSSLQVSPLEQAAFLASLLQRQLPVSHHAMEGALSLLESPKLADGWHIWGKTGSAYPRRADYSFDYARGWGWYIGWAEKAGRQLVFVRLNQDEQRHDVTGGLRAREEILTEWRDIVARTGS